MATKYGNIGYWANIKIIVIFDYSYRFFKIHFWFSYIKFILSIRGDRRKIVSVLASKINSQNHGSPGIFQRNGKSKHLGHKFYRDLNKYIYYFMSLKVV